MSEEGLESRYEAAPEGGRRSWQGLAPARLPAVEETAAALAGSAATRRFHTPVRLKRDSHVNDSFSFPDLTFRMVRRALELAHFHLPGAEVDWHFRPLLELASGVAIVERDLRFHDWERWSNRQQTSMRLGGLVGSLRLEGDLAPFAPLLATAQVTHVGKGRPSGWGGWRW